MATQVTPRWRIEMNIQTFDDPALGSLVIGIGKVSAGSALMQIPSIAACIASLQKKGATLVTDNNAVTNDEHQLKLDITARDLSRVALVTELVTLKSLAANYATSAADITGLGLTLLNVGSSTRTIPPIPASLLTKIGKTHGVARVSVDLPKGAKGNFVAESSPDPVTPTSWSPLPGNGKQRVVTGASGTKVWVRFAQVRYGLQSDWSTPVLVTIP